LLTRFTRRLVKPLTAINFYAIEALRKVAGLDVCAKAVETKRGFGIFDKVNGSDRPRKQMQEGVAAIEIVDSWKRMRKISAAAAGNT
jgi:hypothetical protein